LDEFNKKHKILWKLFASRFPFASGNIEGKACARHRREGFEAFCLSRFAISELFGKTSPDAFGKLRKLGSTFSFSSR